MKQKFFSLIIFLTVLLFSFAVISAQEKVITETDFDKIVADADKNIDGKTYRLTETEKYFPDKNGEAESTKINLTEFVLPDKRRTVRDVASIAEFGRYETIWDGKTYYTRKNFEDWQSYRGGGEGSSVGSGDFTSGKISKIHKYLGTTEIDKQKVKLYSEEKMRIANKLTRNSTYQVYYYENTKYWISENGLLLKIYIESGVEKVITPEGAKESKAVTRKTSVYEYDPNIKIEAPIINKEVKK